MKNNREPREGILDLEDYKEHFAVQVLITGLKTPLSYSTAKIEAVVGDKVSVELGNRLTHGWVVERIPVEQALKKGAKVKSAAQLSLISEPETKKPGANLKPVLSASPAFQPEQLKLFNWMADYYGCPLVDVIEGSIPKINPGKQKKYFRISSAGKNILAEAKDRLKLEKRAPEQFRILHRLNQNPESEFKASELEHNGKSSSAVLNSLDKKNLVLTTIKYPGIASANFSKIEAPNLNSCQLTAVSTINKSISKKKFDPFLLYGVTGSGKTEVYLHTIETALSCGGSALVVVPEISLTPQALERYQSRLGIKVALLHSQLGTSERWQAWQALLEGKIRVAVGARSAIFAPLTNLSVIIVDEEHEQSYKQSEGMRYNGRDVAVMRARFSSCPVVLGSATPSFESLLNVKKKNYQLLELPKRATSRAVPQIEIVDLGRFRRKEMPSESISPPLAKALKETLKQGEQAVILYNRRGFSSYLQCESCGKVLLCPECSISMTWHKHLGSLSCHFCDSKMATPEHCSHCLDPNTVRVENSEDTDDFAKMAHRGGGTEKVVDEIKMLCPEARLARMDRDTVGQKGAYKKILDSMHDHEADILVGTQMIAKGHDLPGVTLVGIIDADIGLYVPDFRSSERVFQLITQAGGRAGRGESPGRVLVQTRQANHPTIVATSSARFMAFARYELDHRNSLNYPPCQRLLRFIISAPVPTDARSFAQSLTDLVKNIVNETETENIFYSILGPSPAPYEKLRGRWRWHLLVKCSSASFLSGLALKIRNCKKELIGSSDIRISIDIDPQEML